MRAHNRSSSWFSVMGARMTELFQTYKPHLVLSLTTLSLSIFVILLHTLVSHGTSAAVFVVYEHFIATALLITLAFFLEKEKRPPLSFKILCWAFCLGFLQISLSQFLLTSSLRYISATVQSISINTSSAVTFVLAVVFRQEAFRFCSANGQAKMWGILISAGGATALVVWTGPNVVEPTFSGGSPEIVNRIIGCAMVGSAILAGSATALLLGHVTKVYPADLTLSAFMCFFGTLQIALFAAFTEDRGSWDLNTNGGLELVTIFYGGIVVTGLSYYAQIWCIHKKGAVFASAFSPLLIVFSFVLEALVLGNVAHLGSILGAALVIGGLYLLLWGKANDTEKERIAVDGNMKTHLLANEQIEGLLP